jgi:outer membrane protein OmpA-like peptidoglycan-associated protein
VTESLASSRGGALAADIAASPHNATKLVFFYPQNCLKMLIVTWPIKRVQIASSRAICIIKATINLSHNQKVFTMKRLLRMSFSFLIALTMVGSIQAQNDRKGSSDHPLISRMSEFWIAVYQENVYESHSFRDSNDIGIEVEGHYFHIEYRLKTGAESPGRLMILKNYENALKKIDGKPWIRKEKVLYAVVENEGREVWIEVQALDSLYRLTIVERELMKQKVTVNPDALFGDIATTGHALVYGIYFDLDSANIKPESYTNLKAIADMLKTNSSLMLYVVGHTDMTGGFDYNMELSLKRAQAVVDVLVNEHGIATDRLTGKGAGPLCPVGSNKDESGRKLNRRVELVEM